MTTATAHKIVIKHGAVFDRAARARPARAYTRRRYQAPPNSSVEVCVAGWICYVLSLLLIWLLPVSVVLWLVALIMAIVALARGDIGAGMALLLCVVLGPVILGVLAFLGLAGLGAAMS